MIFFGYIAVFTAAGLGCFAGAYWARNIPDRDTRHGLVALLGLSGLWATAQVGYLSASTLSIGIAFYIAGLTVGLATVWAWLYFCFSYTGRSLQHNATAQRVALALFAGIVLLKLTNPLHHLYFTTEWTSTPFPHFAIQIHTLHWVTFGLAYALSAVGIFVMGKFFAVIASGTRPLVILVGLTSLPALFNAAGQASTILPQVGHEPIGVAAFAIGILFVYADQFHDVHRASNREAPVLVLDGNERIRTYNEKAAALFPKLQNTTSPGKPLAAVVPELAEARQAEPALLERVVNSRQRSFLVCESRLGTVHRRPGRLLLLTDVSRHIERERALQTAKEAAEEASQLKSAILANMTHEVRTPLTSILSFAGILKNNVSGQNARYADLVLRGGERLQNTLDSVLRLSELETGGMELEKEAVDLVPVARTTTDLLRPEAEGNGIQVRTSLPNSSVEGQWDEDALYHIVENLLENAIKFTPEDGRVDVRVRQNEADAILEVQDTGIGIPEADQHYIFEAFRQVEQGANREYDGTGLGLPIVKKLIDAHSGHIDVESTPGEGSRFTVHLPKTRPADNGDDSTP